MRSVRFVLGSLLLSFSFIAGAGDLVNAEAVRQSLHTPIHDHGAFVVRNVNGNTVCYDASRVEALRINAPHRVPVKVFGEGSGRVRTNASAGLNIILRGTAQLDGNPAAKAAFERAADIWESRIADQINVYVDVDFGTTRFGEAFEENVIASAQSDYRGGGTGIYGEVRGLMAVRGHNANEIAVYNALPTANIPTDLGVTTGMASPSMLFRAIGALDANPPESESAPSIGFNSAFPYDFDPSNGISAGQTDFEGVVVHEIGHMLGFVSRVGSQELGSAINAPSVFDLFRFRPGITLGTFGSANRIQSSGGEQVYFTGTSTLAMSTGRPDGTNGDEQQASHWKDDALSGSRIGVMDPTISKGFRSEITNADLQAFGMMGYNIVSPGSGVPAAPTNLTATGISTSQIRLNWTDNSNNETDFVVEQKVGANFVALNPPLAANTTQIPVGGFTAGQSATFRVRARNANGNSGYSNEATGTTSQNPGSCTANDTTVCLLNNRFRVKIDYVNPFSNPPNQPGTFRAARLLSGVQNPDTGLFGFSSAQAVEVVVRLQDTRPFAPRFDVYYGGMTDVGYTVTVTDTQTGTTRQYSNTAGNVGGGVDRTSFPTSALGAPDRLITSGGTDSFPAEEEPAPLPGDLVGIRYGRTTEARTATGLIRSFTASVTSELEKRNAKSLNRLSTNAGGGGGCNEVEPNETTDLADVLPLATPCTGTANFGDAFDITVDYGGSVPDGRVHDVFEVTTGAAGPLTVTMTFTTASADLDVVGFRETGSIPPLAGIGNSSNTGVTTESFTTASLAAGTYYIGVSAYEGGSNYTLTVTGSGGAIPTAPSNLAATGTSTSVIRLTWNDNSNNETDFVVEQKVGVNFVALNPPLNANTTAVNVTDFQPSTSATFRIKARGAGGDSAYSNEATGTTQGGVGPCTPNSTTVCLLSNRFRVKIDYVNPFSNPPNQPGTFLAARLSSQAGINPDVALFGFSSAQAVEVVVRVQDTRPFAPRFDIYYGGMTDVGYTVTVTDTQTGTTRTYSNTAGNVGGGVDRNSFPAN
ncbi:MAG TPA: NF038122 family metalloprotease [Thermoanaerobaculia bacterium]|jgi:hypothetical protein|nr:NF038122 family metalloprotease [Thermoanaerobaculia bacterium]